MAEKKKEVWLRGPIDGVPKLLQPVAHALLQACEEVNELLTGFDEKMMWQRPAGVASPAFHLQHLSGVLDRLFSYARGQSLSAGQLEYLRFEGQEKAEVQMQELLQQFNRQVQLAIEQLKNTDENTLTEARGVGRAQLPSTVLGLLAHAAEHTMRHTGQLYVTIQVLTKQAGPLK